MVIWAAVALLIILISLFFIFGTGGDEVVSPSHLALVLSIVIGIIMQLTKVWR
jgi:hypothetical protein